MIDLAIGSTERLLNALLEESTAARERVEALEGKTLGLYVDGLGIGVVLRAAGGRLGLERGDPAAADASLGGTPIALIGAYRLARSGGLERDSVRSTGDAQTLADFVAVLALAEPDLEEALARLTGDVIAHETFRTAGRARAWAARAADTLAVSVGEYLQEESRDLPARHEAEALYRDIEQLRDDVERALARAARMQTNARSTPPGAAEADPAERS